MHTWNLSGFPSPREPTDLGCPSVIADDLDLCRVYVDSTLSRSPYRPRWSPMMSQRMGKAVAGVVAETFVRRPSRERRFLEKQGSLYRFSLTGRPDIPIRLGFLPYPNSRDTEYEDFVLHNIS